MKEGLTSIADKHAPLITKRVKGRPYPWVTYDLKALMNTRDKLLRKARKSKNECDWSTYKRLKNSCNNKVKQAKQKYHKYLLHENCKNPAKFWKCIKEIFPTKEHPPASATTSIDHEKNLNTANVLCKFFTNIAQSIKSKAFKLRNFVWKIPPKLVTSEKVFTFGYVSRIFVEKELRSLKRRKAADCDNLPPGILKDAAQPLSGPLAHLINMSISTGLVPTKSKIAKITPTHKGGATDNNNNYRPIFVLSSLSKILEKAVHKQLSDYPESNNILSENQFGYRKRGSTELTTILLTDNIRKAVDKGNLLSRRFVKKKDLQWNDSSLHNIQLYGKLKFKPNAKK